MGEECRRICLCGSVIAWTFIFVPLASTLSVTATDEPPVVVDTKHVLEHENLTLMCNTSEAPPPEQLSEFLWMKEDAEGSSEVVYSREETLHFVAITTAAAGTYICHAVYNVTGDNVTVVVYIVDVETSDGPDETSIHIGIVIGCSIAGCLMLVLVVAALVRRKSKAERFSGKNKFGYSMKSQYGSSLKSTHDSSVKARYGTLSESRGTLDGSQTAAGYPKIVYRRDTQQDPLTESTGSASASAQASAT